MDTTYRIQTEGDAEGRSMRTLGYATGNISDIKAYFQDRVYYNLEIQPIRVVKVTPTSASERLKLFERKQELQAELKRIKEELDAR